MKLSTLFKKTPSNDAPALDLVLDSILKIEAKRADVKTELENARKHLEHEQVRNLDGDDGANVDAAVSEVVKEQARLDSLEGLLKQAETKAIGMIAAGSAQQRQRLQELEAELAETMAAVDVRKIKTFSEFAKKHGLRISWPTKHQGGAIHLPALSIDGGELERIADATVTSVFRDEAAGKMEALLSERQRLNLLIQSQPDLGLQSLLAEKRRR